MNTQLIIWTVIVAITATIFVVSLTKELISRRRKSGAPLLSIGEEWEEIYVPGDPIHHSDYDYSDNPSDD